MGLVYLPGLRPDGCGYTGTRGSLRGGMGEGYSRFHALLQVVGIGITPLGPDPLAELLLGLPLHAHPLAWASAALRRSR